jgi:hypothetical protein
MTCAITTTAPFYQAEDPKLARYRAAGLEFEPVEDRQKRIWWALKPCTREFTTVGELCGWMRALGQEIILGADGSIDIYDDYRE